MPSINLGPVEFPDSDGFIHALQITFSEVVEDIPLADDELPDDVAHQDLAAVGSRPDAFRSDHRGAEGRRPLGARLSTRRLAPCPAPCEGLSDPSASVRWCDSSDR